MLQFVIFIARKVVTLIAAISAETNATTLLEQKIFYQSSTSLFYLQICS